MITAEQAGRLLMITRQRIEALAKDGHIPRAAKGKYPLVGVVQGYVNFLKDEARRTSKSAAASRVTDARAQEIELRIRKQMHELIDINEHDAIVDEAFGALKARLIGIPVRVTRDMTLRRRIEDEINGALASTASDLLEKAASLRSSGEVPAAQPEDDAG